MTLKELNTLANNHGYDPDTLCVYVSDYNIKYIGLSKDTMYIGDDNSIREDYEKFIEVATGDDINEIDQIINNFECIHDRCEDCPHWTGSACDGDLSEGE